MIRKTAFFLLLATIPFFVTSCARTPKQPTTPVISSYPASGAGFYYTVERGQTLYRIAKAYQTDVSELMRINHIYSPTQLKVGQKLWIPKVISSRPTGSDLIGYDKIRSIVGPVNSGSNWQTITLHHSATLTGNARLFDRDHRRRKMGGLFYHFVIGNGTKSVDGAVEVGWRWKKQVKANRPYDIQICLVGNFNEQQVSEAQFNSVYNLVKVLRDQYHVPMSNIRRHDDIKGKHTECPGRNFPLQRLLSKLAQN